MRQLQNEEPFHDYNTERMLLLVPNGDTAHVEILDGTGTWELTESFTETAWRIIPLKHNVKWRVRFEQGGSTAGKASLSTP